MPGVTEGLDTAESPAPLSGLGVFASTAGATSFCRAAAFAVFVRHKAEGVLSQPERRWLATSPRIREEVISESGLPQMPILGNLFAIAPVRRAKIAVRFYQQGWIPAMPLQVDGTRTTATARPQTRPQMLGGAHPRSAPLSYPPALAVPARCRSFSPALSYRFGALASTPQFFPPVHRALDKGWVKAGGRDSLLNYSYRSTGRNSPVPMLN